MSLVVTYGVGYAAGAPGESYLLMRRKGVPLDGTHPLIVCLHGHGGTSLHYLPGASPTLTGPGYHAWRLAESGFIVLAIDAGGTTTWGDAAAIARITDAVAFAAGLGAKTTKIGLMGWSMGCAAALNWIKRNPAEVGAAWLWAAATDLDFFNATAGYVPSYSAGGVAMGAFASEIAADFNPYSSSAGFRIHDEPASFAGIAPIKIAHAADDATIPQAQSASFVAAVNDPLVTFRAIAAGGHTGLFGAVGEAEVIQHFAALG